MKRIITKLGLSSKMIIVIFANVAVITAIIFFYIYKVSSDTINENLRDNSQLLTNSIVEKVENILLPVQRIPENFALLIESGDFSERELNKLISIAVGTNKEIIGMAIAFEPYSLKPDSRYYSLYAYKENGEIKNVNLGTDDYNYHIKDWYQIPKELNMPMWSEPYFDEGGANIIMTTYSVPIYKTENEKKVFIGILTADVSLDWLHDVFSEIKVYETGYAFLISKNGSIVSHPRKEVIMNETIFTIAEEAKSDILREIGRLMIKGGSSFAELEYKNVANNKLSWISFAPVSVNGWSVGVVYPVEEFRASLNSLFATVLILAFAGAFILLLAIIFISKKITKPLSQLAFVSTKFSEGNYDAELPINNSTDEIGNLTKSFSVMQQALKNTIHKLKEANKGLEEYSTTLEEKVEERTSDLNKKNNELDKALENVKTLSSIGREITSTLNLESIFNAVYESVNTLLDAYSFTIMVYNQKENSLDCKLAIEQGKKLPEFSFSLDDKNRFAVWCFDNKKPVFINDVEKEYSKYIFSRSSPKAGLFVSSLIYLPLVVGEKIIGVVSAQSLNKNAYNQSHLDILNNLANYAAIALDNAFAYANIKLANSELKEAQAQLIQAEKMASLGQLTAGIAHEIKNPLNFINNFSELSIELADELLDEINKNIEKFDLDTIDDIKEILSNIDHNVKKINEHGKRADSIVKGMLLHSRGKAGEKQFTNLNDLVMEYLNLAYHGFRAQDSSFNLKMETEFDQTIGKINVVPQNLSRVLLNIFNNACYSVNEKKKELKGSYNPVLKVVTKEIDSKIMITITDNGKGIPQDILDKVFNPFFTTKPTGKGTGLGLSLSYDIIVQEHKGDLKVNSQVGEFAEFIITIPKNL